MRLRILAVAVLSAGCDATTPARVPTVRVTLEPAIVRPGQVLGVHMMILNDTKSDFAFHLSDCESGMSVRRLDLDLRGRPAGVMPVELEGSGSGPCFGTRQKYCVAAGDSMAMGRRIRARQRNLDDGSFTISPEGLYEVSSLLGNGLREGKATLTVSNRIAAARAASPLAAHDPLSFAETLTCAFSRDST